MFEQDDTSKRIYDLVVEFWDLNDFFGLLDHNKLNHRVLEIGAGTSATTALILDGLISTFEERMFYSYTYTDISAGFFVKSKERSKSVQRME